MSISVIIFGEKTTLNHEIKAISSFLADAFTEKQLLKMKIDFFIFIPKQQLPKKVNAPKNINFYYIFLPENADDTSILDVIKDYNRINAYDYIFFGTTVYARSFAVKYAIQEKTHLATNIKGSFFSETVKTWEKDIFLGNISKAIPVTNHRIITLAKNIPATYDEVCYPAWKAIPVEIQSNDYITAYTKENKNIVVGWEQAEKIIVIGNGVDKNGYPLIEQFAKQINAEIAGTRRAVENGLLPVERMIGLSGKSISPKLCIVIGASGLAAFVKGIEKSECIVSINSDKDALIFKYADYGIIGHYQEVITVT